MSNLRETVETYENQAFRCFQQTDGTTCSTDGMINGQGQQAISSALFAIAHGLVALVEAIESKP